MPLRRLGDLGETALRRWRTVAVFSERCRAALGGEIAHRHATPWTARNRRIRSAASAGSREELCPVGEAEDFGEMQDRAGALLPADHGEMVLVAVQPGEEDDPGLVEASGRGEDQARQRHGRAEYIVEALEVSGSKPAQGRRGRRRDGVENPEQRIGMTVLVAGDQLREVEVVAAVHADARREPAAHLDLPGRVEQRDLDAVDLLGMRARWRRAPSPWRSPMSAEPQ